MPLSKVIKCQGLGGMSSGHVILQTAESQERGANQILDALEQRDGLGQMSSSSTEMPSGFLERFAEEYEKESLSDVVATLGK